MRDIELRDWFAGMALQGLLAGQYSETGRFNFTEVIKEANDIADAMLEARGKSLIGKSQNFDTTPLCFSVTGERG